MACAGKSEGDPPSPALKMAVAGHSIAAAAGAFAEVDMADRMGSEVVGRIGAVADSIDWESAECMVAMDTARLVGLGMTVSLGLLGPGHVWVYS